MLLLSVVMEFVETTKVLTFALKTAAQVASVVMGPVRDGWGKTVRPALMIAWAIWILRRLAGSFVVVPTSGAEMRGALGTGHSAWSAALPPQACLTLFEP